MKIGLVTIVIGQKYTELFNGFSRSRFEYYARRHGYETLVVDKPIRELPGKKLTWQKCCLHDLEWVRSMDMVAFLDSDILIAKDAPALPLVEPGKVGGVMDKPRPDSTAGSWFSVPARKSPRCSRSHSSTRTRSGTRSPSTAS
ncbi:MAG: hypothetical protein WCH98_22525 [Verrucomicrobiota bacterium]